MAGNRYFVFQSSMYSALPTYVMRRGRTVGSMKESITDVWLGQRMAGPASGTRATPRRWMRHAALNTGVRMARATG